MGVAGSGVLNEENFSYPRKKRTKKYDEVMTSSSYGIMVA